jgi:hypothetical protein
VISSHAAKGTSSSATYSLIVSMGGKRGIALIDSDNIDSFLDYTFASRCHCNIVTTDAKKVRVAGGGYLESDAITTLTPYFIQNESFSTSFK